MAEVVTVIRKAPIWDPLNSRDWDNESYSREAIVRIKRDLQTFYKDPPPGICVIPRSESLTDLNILITGPSDTPYEGGLFQFILRFPPNYPMTSPRVRLMTTGHGTVRFNPNLYPNGMICLSILGTWAGPGWSEVQSLLSVLLSIQSLMNSTPYSNEPGHDQEDFNHKASEEYNNVILHETLRVAVCAAMETDDSSPSEVQELKKVTFSGYYDYYIDTIAKMAPILDGFPMKDPFGHNKGTFNFKKLSPRLETIQAKMAL